MAERKQGTVSGLPASQPDDELNEALEAAAIKDDLPKRKKGTVFRVRGLQASQSDDELKEALKAVINDNLANNEKSELRVNVAIVPSCYENDERVALVEFYGGVPAFLSGLTTNPLDDWQVEMGDEDISFDQHFFGFTQLYAPQTDSPATADIIAITGLDGHAYGSWRGKGDGGRMWLRDFLSKDMPCCRTMIYGYNSKLSTHGVDTIMDYGRELIEELKKIRNTEELQKRPVFFIAHSFGGIILAHCLVKAVQTAEDDHPTIASLHRATYGMLLFGIPLKGLVVDDIQKMLTGQDNHPRNALLEQIRSKSDVLAFQLADFKNLIRDRKVVSFYEMGQTRQLEFDIESKRWKRTGNFVTAVDVGSALLDLPDLIEDKIPLDADHSMMVKFNTRNDRGYTSARHKLREFEKDAPSLVAARFLRPQNTPKPSLMIPFPRDEALVGREDNLVEIRDKFEQAASQNHCRVALVGLGGIGKSQIAIEYAYRVRKSVPQTWVFWVHGSDAARFRQSYTNIAAKIELPGRDDPEADIITLVKNWLCDERNGRWLIILDNADDDQVFSSTGVDPDSVINGVEAPRDAAPLESFLPQSVNGWILVTSRDLVAAVNLIGTSRNVIRVGPMVEEDALKLLKTRISVDKAFENDAKALVEALGCIPLAVSHAGAYLAVRVETITVSTYLQLFRENDENQAHLLSNQEARDMRRDGNISVLITWQISFEQIQKTRPEAAEVLSLMAMFDRQGIPESILYDGKSRLQFEDAVGSLTSFSLIKTQGMEKLEKQVEGRLFGMHNLVQLATRKWLDVQKQLGRWEKASLRIMADAFPSGAYETWATCRMLVPHARKVLGYAYEDEKAMLDRAIIANLTVLYLREVGEYVAAENIGRAELAMSEKVLGIEHRITLICRHRLGSVLTSQSKLKEAETMYQRALEGMEKVLGVEDQSTLMCLIGLGFVLSSQSKDKEAETMYQRALEGTEKVLGVEHQSTLMCLTGLGVILSSQSKYKEAETMYQRALEGMEKVLGVEHPDTLNSLTGLGYILWNQGKYKEAETMFWRALEGMEKVLGVEHPDTLISVGEVGVMLLNQGKYEEAETMFRRALKGMEKVLGVEHPDTLTSVRQVGEMLLNQGKYKEAKTMYQRALEGMEKALGVEHLVTLNCVSQVGVLLSSQGKYEEAETMFWRALKGMEKVLGIEDLESASMRIRLAITLKFQSRNREAITLVETSAQAYEQVYGRHHPKTEEVFQNLNDWKMENTDI